MDTAACSNQSIGPASQLLGLLIQTLYSDQCALVPDWPTDFGPNFIESDAFDFIVVGAGSAGSIVAARLSENPNWNVLLLEAGGDPPIESEIPELYFSLVNEQTDWNNFCEPSHTASLGLLNNSCFLERAKLLGGCGGHNTLLYNRGNERDYNGWAELGNPTWQWTNVLEYFKKSENNQDSTLAADTFFHSTGGPLIIDNLNYHSETLDALGSIFAELGFDFIEDINADKHLGYGFAQGTISDGARFSSAKAFLIPARNRTNLKIIKNAQVTTLTFKSDRSIEGVNFVLNGQNRTALARKEVILSAGTVNTPVILLNSGIGPAAHLTDMNITVISDLAVGQNLQDHTVFFHPISLQTPTISTPDITSSYLEYLTNRTGQFSNVGSIEFTAYFSTTNNPKFPDIQYFPIEFTINDSALSGFFDFFNVGDEIADFLTTVNANTSMVMLMVVLINPKSRGQIKLLSNNPLDNPKIIPNLLSEQADIQTLLKGFRKIQQMNLTETFLANSGQFIDISLKDCDSLPYDSDEYWECNIRQFSTLSSHTVGTTKMGPKSDKESVVDYRLRVRGIKGLRVIDASIMPTVTSGNTNAPVMMIGEKGADFVKKDWTNPKGWYEQREFQNL